MTQAGEDIDLSDDEKIALGNMLFGNEKSFGALSDREREKYLDRFENAENRVNRSIEGAVFVNDTTGPRITEWEAFETSFSDQDSGPYTLATALVINDKAVVLRVSYPEASDDDEGGSLLEYEVHPASELRALIRDIKKKIAADGAEMIFERIRGDEAFDLLMEAVLARRAKVLAPTLG